VVVESSLRLAIQGFRLKTLTPWCVLEAVLLGSTSRFRRFETERF
jgi:hypothetical protein